MRVEPQTLAKTREPVIDGPIVSYNEFLRFSLELTFESLAGDFGFVAYTALLPAC